MNLKLTTIALAGAVSLFAAFPVLADNCEIEPGSSPPVCKAQDLPEPGSLPLFILGAIAVAIVAKKFKK
jgi:hypothetical protein